MGAIFRFSAPVLFCIFTHWSIMGFILSHVSLSAPFELKLFDLLTLAKNMAIIS